MFFIAFQSISHSFPLQVACANSLAPPLILLYARDSPLVTLKRLGNFCRLCVFLWLTESFYRFCTCFLYFDMELAEKSSYRYAVNATQVKGKRRSASSTAVQDSMPGKLDWLRENFTSLMRVSRRGLARCGMGNFSSIDTMERSEYYKPSIQGFPAARGENVGLELFA